MSQRGTMVSARFDALRHGLAKRIGVDEYVRSRIKSITQQTDATIATASQGTQILLAMAYQDRVERGAPLPPLDEVEFKVYSQNSEDGILLFLFSVLGSPTKKIVEICAGDGIECNAANLIVNRGWRGLLFDGDDHNIAAGREFYRSGSNTFWYPPKLVPAWITRDNVSDLVAEHGFAGEIDLLSLDLDGIDYWIWKALECIQPRVVVAEYNWTWGPDESKTVPYDPSFALPPQEGRSYADNLHFGSSLKALVGLGREKGYRLVGCQHWGFNAFFVMDGIGEDLLPEVTTASCFDTPVMRSRWRPEFIEDHQGREWVSV